MSTLEEVDSTIHHLTTPGLTPDQVTKFYDGWAHNYDQDMDTLKDRSYDNGMNELKRLGVERDARILDLACGTGRLSDNLVSAGYRNIDGLDGCKKMLDIAREKRNYTRLIETYFGAEKTVGIEDETYDVVISVGSFTTNHLGPDCLQEVIRITKPGGHVFIQISHKAVEKLQVFTSTCEKHSRDGKWKLISRTNVTVYDGLDGVCLCFQRL